MPGQRPDYTVRAKTGRKDGEDKDIFMTVGAGWSFQQGDGINLRINAIPVNFDGYLMITPAKDDER